ncbi:heme-dependent oxidative N-demethylase family protein [Aspergillus brunneoviolaceus CBS 621.78]|uniref:Uncharacterized protein n=1 Tax=Aspergillus brunneoviolaceus CBS 621.78 TaxID=1450534 RepID=A0ACD1G703_9EURO|nr:hypothetical protein BO95DRAFT_464337 [Aspergillus brunneoviolaceus CBS 621.78]RAH45023.1 hypothetical protein BO95DRAFT_464337 [Aspergillus brunneoviolaceus CBS 621.78]
MDLLTSTVDASILYVERNPFPIVFLVLTLWLFGRFTRGQPNSIDNVISEAEKAGYPPIEPLHSFDWETTEPLQFRPFKAKYHLTMALSNLDFSTLIPIDKTYRSRLAYRQSLLSKYPSVVVGVTPTAETEGSLAHSAVRELYEFVLGVYLPTRYPGVFDLIDSPGSSSRSSSSLGPESSTSDEKEEGGLAEPTATTEKKPKYLLNRITNHSIPTKCPTSAREALTTLGTVVDEDFLILLPTSQVGPPYGDEEKKAEEDEYTLQAYTTFYPAGFDTREKLGCTLSAIHDPVPRYKEKLEKSMDRFFARLEVGRFVQRVNWSVTTGTELFAAFGGIHGDTTNDGGEKGGKDDGVMASDELNVDDTFLRCERQTLHRLPETKTLVFTFHTYTYPVRTVKEEGLGEELAQAIDGLKGGSVPEMWWYKRGAVWGEAVKAYLRG